MNGFVPIEWMSVVDLDAVAEAAVDSALRWLPAFGAVALRLARSVGGREKTSGVVRFLLILVFD